MSQCTKSLLADYVAASRVNYIYPSYTLPSNNFYGGIKPPYYLANNLRNLEISTSLSSKHFHAKPTATFVPPSQLDWSNASFDTSVTLSSDASKLLTSKGTDTNSHYHYKWDASVQLVSPAPSTQGYVLIGLNLDAAANNFVKNLLEYVNNSVVVSECSPHESSSPALNPCDPGNPFVPKLDGTITMMKGKSTKVINVKNAVPLVPGQISCQHDGDDDEDSPVQFAILGNRLYLAVEKDSDSEWDMVMVSLSAGIVEEKNTTPVSLPSM